MAVTFVNTSQISVDDSSGFTCDYPQNNDTTVAQVGQLMLLAISWTQRSGTPVLSVSGWTAVNAVTTASRGCEVYYKQGDGTGFNASIAVAGGTVRGSAAIAMFSGTATSSPIDTSGVAATAVGLVHSIIGITTSVANDLLFGAWAAADTGIGITAAMNQIDQIVAFPGSGGPNPGRALTTSYDIQATAANTGAKNGGSFSSTAAHYGESTASSCQIVFAAIKPFSGPTTPTITAPADGENIAIGRIYAVTWTPATDPAIAQSALTYNIDYSANDGTSWTELEDFTAGGAVTFAWNTAGLTPTSQAKLRIRAHNGTDYSVTYDTTGRFTLSADVTPLAPTNLRGEQPDGTLVTLFDIGVALVIKGTFADPGDVMTAFQLDWGTDGSTYPNTSTNATSIFSKTYSASTFSAGLVYFRCRTADYAATYGPYATLTLTGAAAPAAPNITAPTFASPPTTPSPTITWTSVGQVKYRIRITQAGVEKYNGGYIASGSLSVTSPYVFANSTTYTLYLSIEDSNGLRSAEDSETFTASYIGPDTPTLTATAVDDQGYIELLISNPDSPAYNEIWRYLEGQTTDDAIRIATALPINATFQDYTPISGQGYIYFVRAYASGGGFTNSVVSATTTLTLAFLFLHVVDNTAGTTSNAVTGQIVSLSNTSAEYERDVLSARKRARGRTKLITVLGQTETKKLRYQVILSDADVLSGKLTALEAIFNANSLVCCRDQRANRIFGKLTSLPLSHAHTHTNFQIEVTETDYDEEV